MGAQPLVLAPEDGRSFQVLGSRLVLKATGADTHGAFSLIEFTVQPGTPGALPHLHRDREEAFVVVEGEFAFRLGDRAERGGPGSFVLVPRGVVYTFANAGEAPARVLILHAPAMDGYFVELAELLAGPRPDVGALVALMRRWGAEVPGH